MEVLFKEYFPGWKGDIRYINAVNDHEIMVFMKKPEGKVYRFGKRENEVYLETIPSQELPTL